jgi:8-oxo-dGTP pyrophosphatase MutT (NUDIX family)
MTTIGPRTTAAIVSQSDSRLYETNKQIRHVRKQQIILGIIRKKRKSRTKHYSTTNTRRSRNERMFSNDIRAVPFCLTGTTAAAATPTSDENVATTSSISSHSIHREDINQQNNMLEGNRNILDRTTEISEWALFPMDFSLLYGGRSFLPGVTTLSSLGKVISDGIPANDNARITSEHAIGRSHDAVGSPTSSVGWHTTNVTQEQRESISRKVNIEAAALIAARETRVKERLALNDRTGTKVRLVAGCVPILADGRIVLIGSRKGNDWVGLPKGGWELDETLEEAAIRECFEEAGVLGILGPNLPSFLVESGKAKSKRQEEVAGISGSDLVTSSLSHDGDDDGANGVHYCELNMLTPLWDISCNGESKAGESKESETHPRTHACLTFFPLYVQQAKATWPENSRTRTAFRIEGMV